MIEVKRKRENEFVVTVKEKGSSSKHVVTLNEEHHKKITSGERTQEELIKRSFEFLLKRASEESTLPRFNLTVINRYFPEHESKIKLANLTNINVIRHPHYYVEIQMSARALGATGWFLVPNCLKTI